jgi:hypothetical protein
VTLPLRIGNSAQVRQSRRSPPEKVTTMKPWTFKNWQVWEGTGHILLHDENSPKLLYFKTVDDVISHLYIAGDKEAARALNAHIKQAHA